MVIKAHRVFLIDIPALGSAAFSTTLPTPQGPLSLERLLSAHSVLKLLWDCRGDGVMLKTALQGISLDCVYDVQLMDLATRGTLGERKTTKALSHAGPQRLHRELDTETYASWTTHKLLGKLTFARGYPKVQRVYDDTAGEYNAAVKLLEARGQDLQLEATLDADGTPPADARERDLSEGTFRPAPDDLVVTLRLLPGATWVADYYPGDGFTFLNQVSTAGSFLLGASTLPFLWNVWRTLKLRRGAIAGDNPWEGHTLEWAATSPPHPHNFAGELPPIRSNRPVWDRLHPDHTEAGHGDG